MFRAQREQILANPDSGLEPGPPEASFSQDPTELRKEPVKEFLHLHQDEARQEGRLQEDRDQVAPTRDCCFEVDWSAFLLSACVWFVGDSGCPHFPHKDKTVFVCWH